MRERAHLIPEEDVDKKREVQIFLHFQKYSLLHRPPQTLTEDRSLLFSLLGFQVIGYLYQNN